MWKFLLVSFAAIACSFAQVSPTLPYVTQCKGSDPKLINCIIDGVHHLKPYLAKGIPDIEMPAIEPFKMDDLSLALTSGPRGYKITLRDMYIYGASNYTVTKLKLSKNGAPFEAKIKIPKMDIEARYTSSGVLIILPASGNGTFNAQLGDIMAIVKGSISEKKIKGKDHMNVDKLDIEIHAKDIHMAVSKIFNNNRILTEATNLFLRENGHEVLKVMMPQLRVKLAAVFKRIANQLLTHVPTDVFYVDN